MSLSIIYQGTSNSVSAGAAVPPQYHPGWQVSGPDILDYGFVGDGPGPKGFSVSAGPAADGVTIFVPLNAPPGGYEFQIDLVPEPTGSFAVPGGNTTPAPGPGPVPCSAS